jgi:hypothetical protein
MTADMRTVIYPRRISAPPGAAARVRLRQHDVNFGLAFGNQGDPTATVEDGVASQSHAEPVAVENKRGAGIHRTEVHRSQRNSHITPRTADSFLVR